MRSYGASSERVETFRIKRSDRSKILVEVTQTSTSAEATMQATIVPFKPLPPHELERISRNLGPGIVAFAKSNLGKVVGNGECWTLAREALVAAGAEPPISKNFGQVVPWKEALPGDVIQFRECTFRTGDGGTNTAGLPDHTSIVLQVKGNDVQVLEQNPKPVSIGSYPMGGLLKGTFDVYRPLPQDDEF